MTPINRIPNKHKWKLCCLLPCQHRKARSLRFRLGGATQGRHGLSQRRRLEIDLAKFTEIESGRKSDRPQLELALKLCKRRCATLVIAKLDRLLPRNVHFITRPDGT